jgi:hypothetical protein
VTDCGTRDESSFLRRLVISLRAVATSSVNRLQRWQNYNFTHSIALSRNIGKVDRLLEKIWSQEVSSLPINKPSNAPVNYAV